MDRVLNKAVKNHVKRKDHVANQERLVTWQKTELGRYLIRA
ncbi:hypothetical protein [Pseudoalteromonas xiamenensis]|nr:hypothetical protein [Pseudoalteromonas xiamenensis]